MNKQKTFAAVAAVLLTAANLAAVSHGFPTQPQSVSPVSTVVTTLSPVQVRPSAADLRAAALPATDRVAMPTHETAQLLGRSLIGSQLAMPYYSFGNESGRISKE